MDRRSVLVSSISLLSAKAALANTPQSLRTDIIGFWSLTEAVTIQGGDLIPWYGRRNPITGIITFFDNGWMAVQIAGARPGKVLRAEFPKLSPADKLDFFEQYYAYYGKFEIDEATSTIHFRVVDSLLPFERDEILKRKIQVDGLTLTVLTEPREEGGISHFNRLVWRKQT